MLNFGQKQRIAQFHEVKFCRRICLVFYTSLICTLYSQSRLCLEETQRQRWSSTQRTKRPDGPYPAPRQSSTTASSVCTGTASLAPTPQGFSSRSRAQGARLPGSRPARGRSTATCIRLVWRAETYPLSFRADPSALPHFCNLSSDRHFSPFPFICRGSSSTIQQHTCWTRLYPSIACQQRLGSQLQLSRTAWTQTQTWSLYVSVCVCMCVSVRWCQPRKKKHFQINHTLVHIYSRIQIISRTLSDKLSWPNYTGLWGCVYAQ